MQYMISNTFSKGDGKKVTIKELSLTFDSYLISFFVIYQTAFLWVNTTLI